MMFPLSASGLLPEAYGSWLRVNPVIPAPAKARIASSCRVRGSGAWRLR